MNSNEMFSVEEKTGALYGDLWRRYSDSQFAESVTLIHDRMIANDFDINLIAGKRCLDLGCGGGRASALMLELGARHVTAIDISKTGLANASKRLRVHKNIEFIQSSCLSLDLPSESFDFVWCSGVLHHTADPKLGLSEMLRVLKQGGAFFLLLYGSGGARWKAISNLRPIAQKVGFEAIDHACNLAGLSPAKQRHFLDDLFVPIIQFYSLSEIKSMLDDYPIAGIQKWARGKPKDEVDPEVQKDELLTLRSIFNILLTDSNFNHVKDEAQMGCQYLDDLIDMITGQQHQLAEGKVTAVAFEEAVFGFGHHRFHAFKQ